MDPDPGRRDLRMDFLRRSIDMASGARRRGGLVLVGSIARPGRRRTRAWRDWPRRSRPVLQHAERIDMPLAFEPEPGMFIDTLDRFARLDERIRHPLFDLTIDVGHVHCTGEGDIAELSPALADRGSGTSISRTWSRAFTST